MGGSTKYVTTNTRSEWRYVVDVKVHPKTKKCTLKNNCWGRYDYALLKLNKPYDMSKYTNIQLRLNMAGNKIPEKGQDLTLCGFGKGDFPNGGFTSPEKHKNMFIMPLLLSSIQTRNVTLMVKLRVLRCGLEILPHNKCAGEDVGENMKFVLGKV